MYNNDLCDYSCVSTAQFAFEKSPATHKDLAYEFENVSMNCNSSVPRIAKGVLGQWDSDGELYLIWFDPSEQGPDRHDEA